MIRLLSSCREALQLAADVLEVVGIDFGGEHFVDDWQEIGERSNYRQRCGAVRPHKPADSCQSQCVLDGDEWQSSLIKLCGQQTIGPAYDSAGARRRAIHFQQSADILALIHYSSLWSAERRPVDSEGVAVMTHAAQQGFDHRLVAEKVLPLVIDEVRRNDS